jgi:hypothetical protein
VNFPLGAGVESLSFGCQGGGHWLGSDYTLSHNAFRLWKNLLQPECNPAAAARIQLISSATIALAYRPYIFYCPRRDSFEIVKQTEADRDFHNNGS